MSTHEPLRVAIVGYGLAGSVFHAPLVSSTPGMAVAAIVTANPERQAGAARDYPTAAIVPEAGALWEGADQYDLVVIATPNRSHVPLAMAALRAGIPVVVDKPLAPSAAAAHDLVVTAQERGVPLTVFQNRRWDGDYRTVRTLLADGALGRPVRFESRFERYRPVPKTGAWRERPDPDEAGGLLFDLGSHLIDQAVQLFGDPSSVYAEVKTQRPGAQVDDDTFVALTFPQGVQAHLWMNTVVRILGPRFHVSGLRGSYLVEGLDPQEPALKEGMRPGDAAWGTVPVANWGRLSTDVGGVHVDGTVETLPGQYEAFYAGVRDALLHGAPLPVQAEDAVRVLEIIEAAQRSAREGRVMYFEEGRR